MTDSLLLNPADVSATAPEVFRCVWRSALDQPGFALLRFAREVSSHELRRAMVELVAAFPVAFVPERFGRFDQQVSSKFHRDGAPPASLLILGYEPTVVRSRFWIADASAAAARAGLGLKEYLTANHPMFPAGEAELAPFVTKLDLPHGEAFVIVANNSFLPFGAGNPLGVLHKAVIPSPDAAGCRVINSIGFTPRTEGVMGLPAAGTRAVRYARRSRLISSVESGLTRSGAYSNVGCSGVHDPVAPPLPPRITVMRFAYVRIGNLHSRFWRFPLLLPTDTGRKP